MYKSDSCEVIYSGPKDTWPCDEDRPIGQEAGIEDVVDPVSEHFLRRDRFMRWGARVCTALALAVPTLASANSPTAALANVTNQSDYPRYTFELGYGYPIDQIANYNQGDPRWGSLRVGFTRDSLARGGCGPTAAAMVVATMDNKPKVTPPFVGYKYGPRYFWHRGKDGHGNWDGLMAAVGRDYNLEVRKYGNYKVGSITTKELKDTADLVQGGGMAIALAANGYFTHGGHFIVIRAANEKGLFIADPSGTGTYHHTENRPFSPDFLKGYKGGLIKLWTFE